MTWVSEPGIIYSEKKYMLPEGIVIPPYFEREEYYHRRVLLGEWPKPDGAISPYNIIVNNKLDLLLKEVLLNFLDLKIFDWSNCLKEQEIFDTRSGNLNWKYLKEKTPSPKGYLVYSNAETIKIDVTAGVTFIGSQVNKNPCKEILLKKNNLPENVLRSSEVAIEVDNEEKSIIFKKVSIPRNIKLPSFPYLDTFAECGTKLDVPENAEDFILKIT